MSSDIQVSTGILWLDLLCIAGALMIAMFYGIWLERHKDEIARRMEVWAAHIGGDVEPYTLSWTDESGNRDWRTVVAMDARDALDRIGDRPDPPSVGRDAELVRGTPPADPVFPTPEADRG